MAQALIRENVYCQPGIGKSVDLLYVNQPLITIYTERCEELTEDELFELGSELMTIMDKNPVLQERLKEAVEFYEKTPNGGVSIILAK